MVQLQNKTYMAKLQDEINSDKVSHGGFGITDRTETWVWIPSANPRLPKGRQRHSLITGSDHQGHVRDSEGAGLRCLQLQENVIHNQSNFMLLWALATKGEHSHGSTEDASSILQMQNKSEE